MLNSFIASIMNMSAEIYIQQNAQDKSSGAIVREWVYSETVPCKVEPIKTGGASTRGDNKTFDKGSAGGYQEHLQLRIKVLKPLSKRWRITSIRTSDGLQPFVELDRWSQPDSIFEVTSAHPVLDPFGKINYYEGVLKRVPVQHNDQTSD